MAWPLSRLTTYLAGITKVKGADLNAIQDQVIDLSDGVWATQQTFTLGAVAAAGQDFRVSGAGRFKHGTLPHNLPAGCGRGSINSDWTMDGAGFSVRHVGGSSGTWFIPIPLINGERITYVQARVLGNTTKVLRLRLFKVVDAAETQVGVDGANSSTDGTATWQDLVTDSVSEVCSGQEYFYAAIAITTAAAEAISVQGIYYETDWP